MNYRLGNGPEFIGQEKVAIVENFRIMNLWFVCLIDKSPGIFLGSRTILRRSVAMKTLPFFLVFPFSGGRKENAVAVVILLLRRTSEFPVEEFMFVLFP